MPDVVVVAVPARLAGVDTGALQRAAQLRLRDRCDALNLHAEGAGVGDERGVPHRDRLHATLGGGRRGKGRAVGVRHLVLALCGRRCVQHRVVNAVPDRLSGVDFDRVQGELVVLDRQGREEPVVRHRLDVARHQVVGGEVEPAHPVVALRQVARLARVNGLPEHPAVVRTDVPVLLRRLRVPPGEEDHRVAGAEVGAEDVAL